MTDHRALMIEAHNRLKELNESFNMARLLMTDTEVRREAGEMVKDNREFLKRMFTAMAFRSPDSENEQPR